MASRYLPRVSFTGGTGSLGRFVGGAAALFATGAIMKEQSVLLQSPRRVRTELGRHGTITWETGRLDRCLEVYPVQQAQRYIYPSVRYITETVGHT